MNLIKKTKHRKPEFSIHSLFIQRWSPRAMSGEEISAKELMSLFEAAKLGAFVKQ